jgi:thiamine biosynthesis lipoprotein
MSTYQPDSELSRFNRAEMGDFDEFSPISRQVIDAALQLAKRSNGAFDPTILPLVEGWGFGAKQGSEQPTAAQIEEWKSQMGWQQVILNEDGTVHKSKADLRLDLSANAKGFGVDHAAAAIQNAGCVDYLIEVGGELRSAGTKADGSAWRIGIDRPIPDVLAAHQLQQVIEVSDWSVATSGDYRNYREVDGKRVSHLIDPRSGYPISHNLASVTVVANDCMTADGLATAISILGVDDGLELLKQFPSTHAYFILRDGDTFTVRESEGFAPFKVD